LALGQNDLSNNAGNAGRVNRQPAPALPDPPPSVRLARPSVVKPQPRKEQPVPEQAALQPAAPVMPRAKVPDRSTVQTAALSAPDVAPKAAMAAVNLPPAPALRELPLPIQRSLPPIKIGGYMYSSSPAERSMVINQRLLREGDQVSAGLTLEQMQAREAVFNFNGTRFRLPY
jgi:general secretion pathway protein B